jgi:cell division protein FtsB
MSFLTTLLFGILKKGAEWLSALLIAWYKLNDAISKRNKEIDEQVAKHEEIVKEIKDSGGEATDEQKKKLIDSARSVIRD